MMKIAVVGASGNLGSEIISKFNLIKNCEVFPVSASNFDDKSFIENNFDAIVYSATSYGRNGEKFSEMMSANLVTPLKILELTKKNQVFINIDTALEENVSDYAFSKGSFRRACQFLVEQGVKNKIINLRLQSFYGLKPNKSDLLYSLTNQFLKNVDSIELTAGKQKKDFIFIEDVVSAIVLVFEKLNEFPNGFHELEIGSGQSMPLRDIILMIKDLTKSSSLLNFGAIPLRRSEPMNLCADITKMKKLGWNPKTSLKEGIFKIIKSIS